MLITEDTTLAELTEARKHLRTTIADQREEHTELGKSIDRNLDRLIYLEAEIENKENV